MLGWISTGFQRSPPHLLTPPLPNTREDVPKSIVLPTRTPRRELAPLKAPAPTFLLRQALAWAGGLLPEPGSCSSRAEGPRARLGPNAEPQSAGLSCSGHRQLEENGFLSSAQANLFPALVSLIAANSAAEARPFGGEGISNYKILITFQTRHFFSPFFPATHPRLRLSPCCALCPWRKQVFLRGSSVPRRALPGPEAVCAGRGEPCAAGAPDVPPPDTHTHTQGAAEGQRLPAAAQSRPLSGCVRAPGCHPSALLLPCLGIAARVTKNRPLLGELAGTISSTATLMKPCLSCERTLM